MITIATYLLLLLASIMLGSLRLFGGHPLSVPARIALGYMLLTLLAYGNEAIMGLMGIRQIAPAVLFMVVASVCFVLPRHKFRLQDEAPAPYILGFLAVAAVLILFSAQIYYEWGVDAMRAGLVNAGTNLYDDSRTVGFPLSIAVHGLPMRASYAPDMYLIYPPGSGMIAAQFIRLAPSEVPDFIAATTAMGTTLYSAVAYEIVGRFGQRKLASLICFVLLLFPPVVNLYHYPDILEPFLPALKDNPNSSTLVWVPYASSFWVGNHLMGSAALGFAIVGAHALAANRDARTFPGMTAIWVALLFCAAVSMDFTILAGLFVAMFVLIRYLPPIVQSLKAPGAGSKFLYAEVGLLFCAGSAALCLLVVELWPALSGATDSPFFGAEFKIAPSIVPQPLNVMVLLTQYLPSVVLIGIVAVFLATERSKIELGPVFRALVATLALFLLAAAYLSFSDIWVWRIGLAINVGFGAVLALLLAKLPGRKAGIAIALVAAIAVPMALAHHPREFVAWPSYQPKYEYDKYRIYRWVSRMTPSQARVAEDNGRGSVIWKSHTQRLATWGGSETAQWIHALVGYKAYEVTATSLSRTVSANDFIVSFEGDSAVVKLMNCVPAPVVYENPAGRVYFVGGQVREKLLSGTCSDAEAG